MVIITATRSSLDYIVQSCASTVDSAITEILE